MRIRVAMLSSVVAFCAAGCSQNAATPPAIPQSERPASAGVPRSVTAAALPARTCPASAVFVRLDQEIRGYPLGSQGPTAPCARIAGSNTQLLERGPLVVGFDGSLHTSSFQSDGTNGLTIFSSSADGNTAPARIAGVDQDHIALAVDSLLNDYVVASEFFTSDNCWYVLDAGSHGPSRANCDTNLGAIYALATNARDELIVAGTEAGTGRGRIDVYMHAASAAPQLVRSIAGAQTGLPSPGSAFDYFAVSLSLASDPVTSSLYVYAQTHASTGGQAARILEFADLANGDAAPVRTLAGPHVDVVDTAFGVGVLSVDNASNLYVIAAGNSLQVSVFGPAARNDATPLRTFSDASALVTSGASLATRTNVPPPAGKPVPR